MAINLTFLQHAAENAVGAAAGGAVLVLTSKEFHLVSDVPWYAVGSAAAILGLGSLLKSLASLAVTDNGTASLNRNVVAKTDTAAGS